MADEFRVPLRRWQKALQIGEVYGCRPGPEVMNRLSTVEEREGTIPISLWFAYLWPDLRHVTGEYAACLGDALRRAVVELRDSRLDLHHRLNDSGAATLTRGAVSDEEIASFSSIRDWCEGGAFDVDIAFPQPVVATLRRGR